MAEVARAEPSDLEALLPAEHSRAAVLAEAIAAGRCLVVRTDGRSVAHLIFGHPFFGHPFIETLYVSQTSRRRGYGRALLLEAINLHRGSKLFTSTNAYNSVMRRLLPALGFTESGAVDNLDAGDPEVFYCHLP